MKSPTTTKAFGLLRRLRTESGGLTLAAVGDVGDTVADRHGPGQPAERADLHTGGGGERAVHRETEAVDPLLAGGGRVEDRAGERRLDNEQRDEESTDRGAHEGATYSNRVGVREAIASGATAAHNRRPRPRRCYACARHQPPRGIAALRGAQPAREAQRHPARAPARLGRRDRSRRARARR